MASHIITGLPAGGLDAAFERTVAATPFAGFLLFRRDFSSLDELSELTTRLRRISPTPDPFLSMDEEGGLVTQLSPQFETAPTARVLGRAASAGEVRAIATELGRELISRGVNLDFAPVYDVDLEPANPVIGPRSFSPSPEEVATLAGAFAAGLRDGGVLPCAKHFPGHGDTHLDSHLSLPICPATREELAALHLGPFRRAIAEDIPLVMVSHVAYPALSPDGLPATLSVEVVSGLLRGELGYDGVIITDAMEMRAVTASFPPGEAAVRALEAGADLLCYGCYDDGVTEAIAALEEAVRSGRLSAERLEASQGRIESLRSRARRFGQRAGEGPAVAPVDRMAICRKALRWVGPERQPRTTVGRSSTWLVVEPDWGDNVTLAGLLESRGFEVIRGDWQNLAGTGPAGADAILVASRHRGAPSPGESLWLAQASAERPTWLVAFAQDVILQEVSGAFGRLSAADPGPTMRPVVAATLFGEE
jgi:beta-glucosidase-like glycosyl hydrolase